MLRLTHGPVVWGLMVVAWALLSVAPAAATAIAYTPGSVLWTLDDVTFCDGGTATGFVLVEYTDSTKFIVNWDVTVSGGSLPPFTFTPDDSTATLTGDPLFDMLQVDPFELQWSTDFLPSDGGDVPITGGFFSANFVQTNLLTGELDGTPVPEPSSGLLLLTGGLALLSCAALRRRSTAQIAFRSFEQM